MAMFKRNKKTGVTIEDIESGRDLHVDSDGVGQVVAKNIRAEGDIIIVVGTYIDERGNEKETELERILVRELLLRQVTNQLAVEKNSKKYIPDIFVEVTSVKDQLRYFSCPVLFFEKILDEIHSIEFNELNRLLEDLSVQPVALDVGDFDDIALSNVYLHAHTLRETIVEVIEQLNGYFEAFFHGVDNSSIPLSRKYGDAQLRYMLGNRSRGTQRALEDVITNLDALVARIFFIVSRAGQGKTNLVCDFVERVLLPRSINCSYFTGREFNHVPSNKIEKYFIHEIFGDRVDNVDVGLGILNNLAEQSSSPTIVVIDGINEHRDISAFSHYLERFAEKLIPYPNIKLVLTCRAEYYEDRFGNFDTASFREQTYFKKDLNRHMHSMHKDQLLKGYFHFFKLRTPFVSRQADKILKNDTLLLRIYCEAYGDPNSGEMTQLPNIITIYRDSIFRKYFARKLVGASQNLDARVGVEARFKRLLKAIILTMITRRQFTDIPIAEIDLSHFEALELLLDEDVVVRKDLVDVADIADVLDERIEVINFTFDEFRDFLLANHLVNVTYENNPVEFAQIIDEFVDPNSSVAEGIRTYLFFASRQNGHQAVLSEIKQRSWYNEIFIRSIFSAEEEQIQPGDIDTIRARFEQSVQDSKWIIKMLTQRWNTEWFPTLNIQLLFDILSTINDEVFNSIVRNCFSHSSYIFGDEQMWSIDGLAKECEELIELDELKEQPELIHLFKLLIFLSPIKVGRYGNTAPAFDAFVRFGQAHPDNALVLLRPLTSIPSLSIRTEVWRILVHLHLSELPYDFVEEAAQHVMEFMGPDTSLERRWIMEVVWFLERYAEAQNVWYVNKDLLEKMRSFSRRSFIYDQYETT